MSRDSQTGRSQRGRSLVREQVVSTKISGPAGNSSTVSRGVISPSHLPTSPLIETRQPGSFHVLDGGMSKDA